MNQNAYRNLISGKSSGFLSVLLRAILRGMSCIYGVVIRVRNLLYNSGLIKGGKAAVPVISIGNITAGGTGKTPLVVWLANILASKGMSCAILTRGYKAEHGKLTDEPAILAKSCPAAKVLVNSKRTESAAKAVEKYGADVLVMDDGFQHRKLKRDLDIIAIDATCPFGYGRLLPGGLLREPKSAIRRADAVVITRYDQVPREQVAIIVEQLRKINSRIAIAKASHKHPYAKMLKGEEIGIEELKAKKIFAFCGIGNPDAFMDNLKGYNMEVVGSKIYNDHHDFTRVDITDICEEARYLGADIILSTQKDWVKTALLLSPSDEIDFAYLALELEFADGADKLEELIDKTISQVKSNNINFTPRPMGN